MTVPVSNENKNQSRGESGGENTDTVNLSVVKHASHPVQLGRFYWRKIPLLLRIVAYLAVGGAAAYLISQYATDILLANIAFGGVVALFFYGLLEKPGWAKLSIPWIFYLPLFLPMGVYFVLEYYGRALNITEVPLDTAGIGFWMLTIGIIVTVVAAKWSRVSPWITVFITLIFVIPIAGTVLVRSVPQLGLNVAWISAGVSLSFFCGGFSYLYDSLKMVLTRFPQPYQNRRLWYPVTVQRRKTRKGQINTAIENASLYVDTRGCFLSLYVNAKGKVTESSTVGITIPGVAFSHLSESLLDARKSVAKIVGGKPSDITCVVAVNKKFLPDVMLAEIFKPSGLEPLGSVMLTPAANRSVVENEQAMCTLVDDIFAAGEAAKGKGKGIWGVRRVAYRADRKMNRGNKTEGAK